MKFIFRILLFMLLIQSCEERVELSSINPANWGKRTIQYELPDTLTSGTSYLSIYSEIYSMSEHRTHDLTATVSMRNANRSDTIYIKRAEYFNTKGDLIRTYFDKPILIAPLETVEIVIDEADQGGGTGANFLFDWAIKRNTNEPFFEGVMISTSGQQGLSFTTQGRIVH